MQTLSVDGGFLRVEGTEGDLCRMLAQRQQVGMRKYGTTVRKNPLSLREWHQHHLEELLDAAIYVMRKLEELDRSEDDGK